MRTVKLLFFATLRDLAGTREVEVEIPAGTTVTGLKEILVEKYINMGPTLETALISINHEFAFDGDEIPDGAELAIFPPVSGG